MREGTDWWVPFYPGDNAKRPTWPLCDGCHSVNYNIRTKEVTEWNVGCEKCHGPGAEHVAKPSRANIVNPSRLDFVHANDVCIQCHSQGRPLQTPIQGRYLHLCRSSSRQPYAPRLRARFSAAPTGDIMSGWNLGGSDAAQ